MIRLELDDISAKAQKYHFFIPTCVLKSLFSIKVKMAVDITENTEKIDASFIAQFVDRHEIWPKRYSINTSVRMVLQV